MTKYEILLLNGDMLNRMQQLGITEEDAQNMQLFEDYRIMKQNRAKTIFVVKTLCERYNKAERTVYRLIKRYNFLCQSVALE